MSIFKDKTEIPTDPEDNPRYNQRYAVEGGGYPAGAPVHTTLSLAEERRLRMSNYPRYDAMDVHHVERPKRGHHY